MLLTTAEAAAILKIHKRTLLEWIADGKVKATRLSAKTIRVNSDDLPMSDEDRKRFLGKTTPAPVASAESLLS